jgi:hypothetical protein
VGIGEQVSFELALGGLPAPDDVVARLAGDDDWEDPAHAPTELSASARWNHARITDAWSEHVLVERGEQLDDVIRAGRRDVVDVHQPLAVLSQDDSWPRQTMITFSQTDPPAGRSPALSSVVDEVELVALRVAPDLAGPLLVRSHLAETRAV